MAHKVESDQHRRRSEAARLVPTLRTLNNNYYHHDYNFVVKNYRDTKDRFYITEVDELIALLEDHQMTIQTSMGSKYVAEIRS